MTVGPTHAYISEGLALGYDERALEVISSSCEYTKSLGLPPVLSIKHISHYTGVNHSYLRSVVRRSYSPYHAYSIPKRSGGYRFIHAPEEKIKIVQGWISRNILYKLKPHWRCYSFHSEASIKSCAAEHCASRWLIKIDIERFFESITEVQVYKLFRKVGYKPLVAFELTRLCTIEPERVPNKYKKRWILYKRKDIEAPYKRSYVRFIGRLPQGAPTSPQISNLVFSSIDELFQGIARKYDLVYTRYADDIAFSSRRRNFTRDDALMIIRNVNGILIKNGFNPQHKKLKIIAPGSRKIVLGLSVDEDVPKLTKEFKKRIEVHLRGIEVFGAADHAKHRKFIAVSAMLDHVMGLINYAHHIEEDYGEKLKERYLRLVFASGLG